MRIPIAVLLLTLAACTTTTENSSRTTETVTDRTSSANPAPSVSIGNVRVLYYQRKQNVLMILVNESHALRKTEKGRLSLALNEADRVYKVLTDEQMTALLTSLDNYGLGTAADPFTDDDSVYLSSGAAEIPRFEGILVVERDGIRRKVLGIRGGRDADAASHARYKSYVDFKTLVAIKFQATSNAEAPIGGVIMPPNRKT